MIFFELRARLLAPVVVLCGFLFLNSQPVHAQLNESFEGGSLPPGWILSGGAASYAGPTGGVSPSIANLAATNGNSFAWITNGCASGTGGNPNGCNNTLGSAPASYGALYPGPGMNGLPAGTGLGVPTLGTTLQSPTFTIGAGGGTISFDVNFVTTDGTYNFADFATVNLFPTNGAATSLFVANTTCSTCSAVAPVGLTPGAGVQNPASAVFSGLPVTLSSINYGGAVQKFGGGNGGPTGWIHVSFPTSSGTYTLVFSVSHVGDNSYPSALAIDNVTTQTQTAPPQPIAPGTTNQITFVNGTNDLVQHNLIWPSNLTFQPGVPNPQLLSSNIVLSNSKDLPAFLEFTPWATAHLFVKAGANQIGGGMDFGSMYDDKCFQSGADPSTASDQNCPVGASDTDLITFSDVFDQVATQKQTIPANTTVSLLHFHPSTAGEDWFPVGTGATSNPVCTHVVTTGFACDLSDDLTYDPAGPSGSGVTGDQTTISGAKKLKGKFAALFNVPMLETGVTVTANPGPQQFPINVPGVQGNQVSWFNTLNLPVKFNVNPAQTLSSTNGWVAAPVNTLAYVFYPNSASEPLLPSPPNCSANSTGPCTVTGGAPGVSSTAPVTFSSTLNASSEGVYTLAWTAKDTVGIGERNIQLLLPGSTTPCPNPFNIPGLTYPCYSTTLFSAQIGVDTTKPLITITTPPNNAAYSLNQIVKASYACTDALSGVASGSPTGTVANGAPVPTASGGIQPFTVTCTDVAGNVATTSVNYTVVPYNAFVQQPINADGSSVFSANRGVIPIKFALTMNNAATCALPPATIVVTRTAGGTLGAIDESVYLMAADTGSNFRISGCQYIYNLASGSLGAGTYEVDIIISGAVVGSGVFALK